MSLLIKQFMGEEFDITKYDTLYPEGSIRDTRYDKGTFVKYGWAFIGDMKEDDPLLDNGGIKADQNSNEEDIADIAYDYEINGWVARSLPPTFGTDGKWRDGRYRIIAAIRKGQQWIPYALYNFEDTETPTKDMITEGLRANPGEPGHRNEMEDFVAGGVKSIEEGELIREEGAIMDFLMTSGIALRYSNNGGMWTRIVNMIIERTANKGSLPLIKSRDDVLAWLALCSDIPSNFVLYKASGGTAPGKFWLDQVLSNVTNPPPVVLWCDAYTPEKSSAFVESFRVDCKKIYKQTYGLINQELKSMGGKAAMQLTRSTELPFKILGVYPNLKRGSQPSLHKQHVLCDVDQYISDGSSISAALKIVA